MGTNKPDSRKTHITRIFGTNRAGDILSDVYADVERMDIVKSAHQVPPDLQWQGLQRQLRWCDDPNADDYNEDGTPSRILEIVKVCDVNTQDPDDPDEWVPVHSIKGLKSRVETGEETNGGSAMSRFLASVTQQELQTARKIEVRKISHYDTNIDDDAQAAAEAGLKHYVVPSEQYERDTGSKDDTQFVDHEIITYLKGSGNHDEVSGQGGQTKLLNQYLIDDNGDPDGAIVGSAGYNPPFRLDPFQNIVNVKFGEDQQYMVSWFNAGETGVKPPHSEYGDDASGASLGTWTVFAEGYVASGKLRITTGGVTVIKSYFLRANYTSPNHIFLGEIINGAVVWADVFTAPGAVRAVSYGNKKFFVSFTDGDGHAKLSVTTDGRAFRTVSPWAGFKGPNPVHGASSVAYQKDAQKNDVYVMVGTTLTTEVITLPAEVITDGGGCNDGYSETVFDINFAWAVSGDGLNWSTGFFPSVYSGIAGGRSAHGSTVAAGNGVFVAGAGKKNIFSEKTPGPDGTVTFSCCTGTNCNILQATRPDYVLDSGAVAVSTNGRDWSLVPLPGSKVGSTVDGDTASNGDLVVFVKHKRQHPDPDIKGFFIATSQTGSSIPGQAAFGSIWKSEDGSSWSHITDENNTEYHYLSAIAEKIVNTTFA